MTCHCTRRAPIPYSPLYRVRDSRCWDAVSGRCGRCGLPYREMGRVIVGGLPSGVVVPEDLDPTETEKR